MTIRFGVVGTAYWAADIHAPGIIAAHGAELVGIHRRSPERTEAAAQRNGVRAFHRFEDMLKAVDAISIAVSPDAQPAYAIRAALAGKHLLLEKPIALDVASARMIVEAARLNRVTALVYFVRRFVPEIAAVIARERTRQWTRASVQAHAAAFRAASPFRDSIWRQEEGAALWDIGPHVLSVLMPMMGPILDARRLEAEPDYVRFQTFHEGGGESDVSLTLRASPDRMTNTYAFSGPAGTIQMPDPAFDRQSVFTGAAEQFVRLIRTGSQSHDCDLSLGLSNVELLAQLSGNGSQSAAP